MSEVINDFRTLMYEVATEYDVSPTDVFDEAMFVLSVLQNINKHEWDKFIAHGLEKDLPGYFLVSLFSNKELESIISFYSEPIISQTDIIM
jgi:hypothetical protein